MKGFRDYSSVLTISAWRQLFLQLSVFRQKLSDVHTKLSDVCPKPSDEQQKPSDEDCSATLGRLFNLLIIFVSQVNNLRIVNKLLI